MIYDIFAEGMSAICKYTFESFNFLRSIIPWFYKQIKRDRFDVKPKL